MIREETLRNLIHGWGFLGYWLTMAALSVLSCGSAVRILRHYWYNLLVLFQNLCVPFEPKYINAEFPRLTAPKHNRMHFLKGAAVRKYPFVMWRRMFALRGGEVGAAPPAL
jgi:hypothetical protein